ncbi:hypothetical protein GE09DRAFT_1061033 [Coniochaeta sp. 2T2.1]|nr:hypothetical protein GE09DRAFT_1061033 [Coniochaeta sp. 2T2.1]
MLLYALTTLALLPIAALAETFAIPNVLYNDSVKAEATSVKNHIDWAKLLPGPSNDTSYDWWYFDVVSHDAKSSATVVFYNSGPHGFINDYLDGPLSASIVGVLPNGTIWGTTAPVTADEEAIISRPDDYYSSSSSNFATSGVYPGSGFSWNGTSLSKSKVRYVVTIDRPDLGVTGTIVLDSVAPAHYPCGPNAPGQTERLFPNVFWSNAVPDAVGVVDLVVNGTYIKFEGAGYHDKNWGDAAFVTTTSTWYWGHANLGPYSIVWFDAFDQTGKEYFSGYVAKDGKVLLGSCEKGVVVARPWGENGEFPPSIGSGVPQGMEVTFDLGRGKTFWANVTTTNVVIDVGVYQRTLGTVEGGLREKGCGKGDGEKYEGASLFEEFKLTP